MHAPFHKSAVAAGLMALGLAAGAAAQTAGTPGPTSSNPAPMSASRGASDAKVARGDRKFIEGAAEGGMAEVQLGQLAAQKAQSADVKQFGQKMVDDHSKANDQLKSIASSKGVTLPGDMKSADRREHDKLAKLSGPDFDREYMKYMVADHKKDVSDFRKEAKSGKDADVKGFAGTTLPTLEQHLQMAQATEAAVRRAK